MDLTTCTSCQAFLQPDWDRCKICGWPVGAEPPVAAPQVPQQRPTKAPRRPAGGELRKTAVFVSVYVGILTLIWGGRGLVAALVALMFFGGIGAVIGAIRGRAASGLRVGSVVGAIPALGFVFSDPPQVAALLATAHLPL